MKKIINLTILSTIILSLTFVPAIKTNAASTVNITYYANNGYFKAKPNRNKSKITIKNKINRNKAKKLNELLLKNKKIDNEIYSLFSDTGDENSEEIIIKIVRDGN